MITSLLQRLKLFSVKRKEFYSFLKNILGFYPGNPSLYKIAFIQKSASINDSLGQPINNERLEYLGDAILGAVIAEYLYNRFPHRGEGFLTQMRSKLVNRVFLSNLMKEINLDQFVVTRTIGNTVNTSIYGDAFEAFIGAIYMDKGYEKTKYVIIKRIYNIYVDLNLIEEMDTNYKSQLIEWGQKNKHNVNFKTEEEEVPKNKNNLFVSIVEIENEIKGKGHGISKKEAQQNAAHDALKKMTPNAQN